MLQEREHSLFKRIGNDLYILKDISLTEALCGFDMLITHLDKREIKLHHPPDKVIVPGGYSSHLFISVPSDHWNMVFSDPLNCISQATFFVLTMLWWSKMLQWETVLILVLKRNYRQTITHCILFYDFIKGFKFLKEMYLKQRLYRAIIGIILGWICIRHLEPGGGGLNSQSETLKLHFFATGPGWVSKCISYDTLFYYTLL